MMSLSLASLPKRFPLAELQVFGMGYEKYMTDSVMACLNFAGTIPMDRSTITQYNIEHRDDLTSFICNNEEPDFKGEKFLRLAAALQTFGDIGQRAVTLNAMLRRTAKVPEQTPSVADLTAILERLEKDLDSTFPNLVTRYRRVVGSSAQPPDPESFLALLSSLCTIANDENFCLADYTAWSVAFIEWCFGNRTIKKGDEVLKEAPGRFTISLLDRVETGDVSR